MHGPSGRCSASPVLTQRCCSNNLGKVARFAACSPLLRASSSPCQDALKSTLLPPYALYRVGVVFGASPLPVAGIVEGLASALRQNSALRGSGASVV